MSKFEFHKKNESEADWKKRMKFDKEELQILDDFEKGNFVVAKDNKKLIKLAEQSAKNYFDEKERQKKDKSITLRINSIVLTQVKMKAMEMKIPYQTLITDWIMENIAS